VAGRNYGCGSSRDTAAKGVALIGVKVVIARSFERIHRTNLVGMGVLPLLFQSGEGPDTLGLVGDWTLDLPSLAHEIGILSDVTGCLRRPGGARVDMTFRAALFTAEEVEYWRQGGILPTVWRELVPA
jgi:aconitate hydratase